MKNLTMFAAIFVLTACGGTNTEKENNTAVNTNIAPSTKSPKVALNTSPIDMDAAFYNGPTE